MISMYKYSNASYFSVFTLSRLQMIPHYANSPALFRDSRIHIQIISIHQMILLTWGTTTENTRCRLMNQQVWCKGSVRCSNRLLFQMGLAKKFSCHPGCGRIDMMIPMDTTRLKGSKLRESTLSQGKFIDFVEKFR